MKLRPFALAAVLAGAFLYVTSVADWDLKRWLSGPSDNGAPFWTGGDVAAQGLSSDENNSIEIYKSSRSAVVNITSTVYREDWFFQIVPEQGTGSGFIIDAEGRILTNYHVVSGTSQLTVNLLDESRRNYRAKILGTDPRNDLALIKIETRDKMPFLKLGDSEHVQVGQKVLAIGNPFGFQGTLTTGIVSSLGRSIRDDRGRPLEELIQTDAAINPGNSGGPLLDSRGNVIGINTAIYGPQGNIGIGFAMPINRAKAMLDELRERGRIARPYLGIHAVYVSGDLAEALRLPPEGGLLVQRVVQGSAAEEAGLRPPTNSVIVGSYRLGVGGDLIMAVDGRPVEGQDSLQRALTRKRAGDTLDMMVYRNGRTQKVQVRLGEAPQTLD
jgi:S1-C subfamily serine protease